jgi:hypothetical protein
MIAGVIECHVCYEASACGCCTSWLEACPHHMFCIHDMMTYIHAETVGVEEEVLPKRCSETRIHHELYDIHTNKHVHTCMHMLKTVGVEGQVKLLIRDARSDENLSRLYEGWAAWI